MMMQRRRRLKTLLVSSCSLAALAFAIEGFFACLDTTPIIVSTDAFQADAGCFKCLEQPENCLDNLQACVDDQRCKPAYDCIVAQSCLDLRTIDDKIKCGLPCAQEAGIESVTDPVVSTHLVGILACGQQKCAEPCNLDDSGVGL
jgi:hypothetical protein